MSIPEQISGISLGSAYIRPGTVGPITSVTYIAGGWITVDSKANLDAIDQSRTSTGQLAFVSESQQFYIATKIPADFEITFDDTVSWSEFTFSGSFSGSFFGDGSGLTGIASSLYLSGSTGNDTLNLKTDALTLTGSAQGIVVAVTDNKATFSISNTAVITGSFKGDGSGLTGVGGVPGGTNGQLQYNSASAFEGAEIYYTSAGSVGLGITNPSARLVVAGDAVITGKITAEEFHTEFVSASIIYQSGSTKFGNSADDNHMFTGTVNITGSVIAPRFSGSFSGSFQGDGSQLTGIASTLALSGSTGNDVINLKTEALTLTGPTNNIGVTVASNTATIAVSNNLTLSNVNLTGSFTGNFSGSIDAVITNAISASFATNAVSASVSDKVKVSTSGTNASYYPTFVGGTGYQDVLIDSANNITYNPSTNALTATTFVGALTGNASTATSASFATTASHATGYVKDGGGVADQIMVWKDGETASGSAALRYNTGGATLNVTGNVLATSFTGSFTGSFAGTVANAVSASYATTASYAVNAATASYFTGSFVDFTTSPSGNAIPGRLVWNSSDGTLDLGLGYGDVVLQLGQEQHFVVRNDTGVTIENGTAVYASGVTAGSGRIEVSPFTADGSIREVRFLGLATQDISDGVNGVVTHFGYVRGLDTRGTTETAIAVGDEDWQVGDILYAHPTEPGKLTNIPPKHKIYIAIVITRHQNVGVLFVRSSSYGHVADIHDVTINTGSLATGDLLVYDSGSDEWRNTKTLSGSYTVNGKLTVTGGITGSLFGTASVASHATTATTASYALTAGSALTATSASFTTNANTATSASHAIFANTAGTAATATSASFATFANTAGTATTAVTASFVAGYAKGTGVANEVTIWKDSSTVSGSNWLRVTSSIDGLGTPGVQLDGNYYSYAQTATGGNGFIAISGSVATTASLIGINASQFEGQLYSGDAGVVKSAIRLSTIYTDAYTIGRFLTPGANNLLRIAPDVLILGTTTINGDLVVGGKVTAEEFHTEFVSASIIFKSGSTIFGNSSDDTHLFTGSVSISHQLYAGLDSEVRPQVVGYNTATGELTYFNSSSILATAIPGGSDNQVQYNNNGVMAGASGFVWDGTNVGIGSTAPGAKLDVGGAGRFTSTVTATKGLFSDSSGAGAVLEALNTVATNATTAVIRQTTAGGNGNQDIGLLVDIQGAADSDRIANFRYFDGTSNFSRMAITRGGNVGIGTISPTQKLDVATGNIALGYNQTATNSLYKDFATYHAAGNVPSELSMVLYDGSAGAVRIKNTRTGAYNSQAIHFDVHEGGVAGRADAMIINYTGNVGIGTTGPTKPLHVVGGVRFSSYGAGSITGTATKTLAVDSSGNVIELDVSSNGTGAANQVAFWKDTDTVSGSAALTWNGSTFYINGTLEATEKSFVIDHPTLPGKKLVYGVLEGPEHAVYCRGKISGEVIQLPEEWTGLVDQESITVQLTPIGRHQNLYVVDIKNNQVLIKNGDLLSSRISAHYFIQATRKDIKPLTTVREA